MEKLLTGLTSLFLKSTYSWSSQPIITLKLHSDNSTAMPATSRMNDETPGSFIQATKLKQGHSHHHCALKHP